MAESTPRQLRNVIGGERVDAASGETTDIVDPSTGQVVAKAPVSSQEDVDRAYASAQEAFATWGRVTPGERQTALLRFAGGLHLVGGRIVIELSKDEAAELGSLLTEVSS